MKRAGWLCLLGLLVFGKAGLAAILEIDITGRDDIHRFTLPRHYAREIRLVPMRADRPNEPQVKGEARAGEPTLEVSWTPGLCPRHGAQIPLGASERIRDSGGEPPRAGRDEPRVDGARDHPRVGGDRRRRFRRLAAAIPA